MTNKKDYVLSKQSLGEEIANSITHGIGAALGTAALTILVVFAALKGDAWRIVSFSIYGASLVILYTSSTLYHAFTHESAKRYFRIMDLSSIFLLIAGTYTPITLLPLRGTGWGWTMFGLIWGMAILGILLKTFFYGKFEKLSILFYVFMGWLVIIAIKPMLANLPTGLLIWIVIGGLSYTIGIIFLAWTKFPYSHTVWHLFVLGGSIAHFFGILFYLV
ncbi:MAG: hemolysin III family protein [Planctomycetia bacterium]|nr:hemolysin III family protein [Planctomycetia bacterium]